MSGDALVALLVVAQIALMLWRDFEARSRAEQQRAWDLEDRAAARKRNEVTARENTGTVLRAIDVNTALTEKAAAAAATAAKR